MTKRKLQRILAILTVLVLMATPLQALATDELIIQEPEMTSSKNSDNIPPKDEISSDSNYSEGCTMTRSTLYGKCFIKKLSSTSLKASGYTTYNTAGSDVTITIKLQAYYKGAWHTLKTKFNHKVGTRVDISQQYNVTSGFYYRVIATHSAANGNAYYSNTKGILIN